MTIIGPTRIRLAYNDSPSEPRVMVFGPLTIDLEALQKCFRRLSLGEGPVDLHQVPFVFVSGDVRIRMQLIDDARSSEGTATQLGLSRTVDHSRSFVWNCTRDGWDYVAELLDGLILSKVPGHQYLTRYPDEDAVIVVSKGEYDDSAIDD